MSLLVYKINTASLKITYEKKETDRLFGYIVEGTYSFFIDDVTFSDGTTLLSGAEALEAVYTQQNIVARIGGDEYINGQLTSLNLDDSALAGTAQGTLTIKEFKPLSSYATDAILNHLPSPQLIESFQETYDFSRNGDAYSFNRDVSIKYARGINGDFLGLAKGFLQEFYKNVRPNYGFQTDSISTEGRFDANLKTRTTERIDLLGLSVGLTESFNSSAIIGDVSEKETISEGVDEEGYKTLDYTIDLQALKEPLEVKILDAVTNKINEILGEVDAQYGEPISISRTLNSSGGVANLTMTFTNDPRKNASDRISYVLTKTTGGKYNEYTLTADISSDGETFEERFQNTLNLVAAEQVNFSSKISTSFSTATIYEKSKSRNIEKHTPRITETITYTEDPKYANNGDGIMKYEIVQSDETPSKLYERVIDLADLIEKVALSNNDPVRSGSTAITCTYSADRPITFGDTFINDNLPSFSGKYIVSDTTAIQVGSTTRTISYVKRP